MVDWAGWCARYDELWQVEGSFVREVYDFHRRGFPVAAVKKFGLSGGSPYPYCRDLSVLYDRLKPGVPFCDWAWERLLGASREVRVVPGGGSGRVDALFVSLLCRRLGVVSRGDKRRILVAYRAVLANTLRGIEAERGVYAAFSRRVEVRWSSFSEDLKEDIDFFFKLRGRWVPVSVKKMYSEQGFYKECRVQRALGKTRPVLYFDPRWGRGVPCGDDFLWFSRGDSGCVAAVLELL